MELQALAASPHGMPPPTLLHASPGYTCLRSSGRKVLLASPESSDQCSKHATYGTTGSLLYASVFTRPMPVAQSELAPMGLTPKLASFWGYGACWCNPELCVSALWILRLYSPMLMQCGTLAP